ncbi:MAG: glycosyltransferase family 2 protein [Acidimicrobiales bacterium]|nr:glycosyltransferase family 2 protein [Acidimicrobiales bacterium]
MKDHRIVLGRLAVVVTVLAATAYTVIVVRREIVNGTIRELRKMLEAGVYVTVVVFLTLSALAYLTTRLGNFYRVSRHHRVARAELDLHFSSSTETLTVLIPSYREDARVVFQTMLSAAIQEFPYMRVVLLIDDPPQPTDPQHVEMLEAARRLPEEVDALLALPREMTARALHDLENALRDREPNEQDMLMVAAQYSSAASWFGEVAGTFRRGDHAEQFLATEVLGRLQRELDATAHAIVDACLEEVQLSADNLRRLMQRLTWIFRCELTSFERKQYASLSSDPNKAMNLNSYLGLMGGTYRRSRGQRGTVLEAVPHGGPHDLEIPAPDYVLTLDADSVLLPEYCLRLVHVLAQPGSERIAVIQTPYSAFPGSSTRLERLAGASTDLQHIVHQGMGYYNATFWVGANAVIRYQALADIEQFEIVDGRQERRYVADRTVIEDTESSIEMALAGWSLENYPERLSYSATPPDFGSLVVQRRRWANGGLIIMPKLFALVRQQSRQGVRGRVMETFLRLNYLASIAWATAGLMLLLAYPFDDRLLSPLVVAAALPYFLAQAADLRSCGYKRTDALRIYGFNLLLLPVNLAGVLKSINQAVTGRKTAFARTPKVRSRTTAPLSMVTVPYLLVALSVWVVVRDIRNADYQHAVFAGLNASLCFYAIVAFVGVRDSVVDIGVNLYHLFTKPADAAPARRRPRRKHARVQTPVTRDWRQVLELGPSADLQRTIPPSPEAKLEVPGRVR